MTVSNGVVITESDLIEHLSFVGQGDTPISIVRQSEELYLSDGTDTFNQLELNEGVITFGGTPVGMNLLSYSWE